MGRAFEQKKITQMEVWVENGIRPGGLRAGPRRHTARTSYSSTVDLDKALLPTPASFHDKQ